MKPSDVAKLIQDAGGTITEMGDLGGGDGFALASFPLPADHWSTKPGFNEPPMAWRCGTDDPERDQMAEVIREATRYAYRASTMNGKDPDMDPDALCQNMVVALLGYWTPDGTSEL